jgi:hypothetical protein
MERPKMLEIWIENTKKNWFETEETALLMNPNVSR